MTGLVGVAYTCGHCGSRVAPNAGYYSSSNSAKIFICPMCSEPTYCSPAGLYMPGQPFGADVPYVPPKTAMLYNEARKCLTIEASTAAVLTCRKLLMHIAVEQGAKEGEAFTKYVDFLVNNFVTLKAYPWVDHIRKQSNKPNHEVILMDRGDAEDLLAFSEMLLRLVYEFPNRIVPATEAAL